MQHTFKEFVFDAAHQTPPHSGLHGHSFRVELVMTGEPDPVFGWTHNLDHVETLVQLLKSIVDHRYLNDIEGLSVPTLENVARWIWNWLEPRLAGLDSVKVSRGQPGMSEGASYSRPDPQAAPAHPDLATAARNKS